MGRKSSWQQFADNFNSVYGTFNNLGKTIGSKKVMSEEYKDMDGKLLEGTALDQKRNEELSKVYTKFGDAEGGLKLRQSNAELEAKLRGNELQEKIFNQLVLNAGLKNKKLEADVDATTTSTDGQKLDNDLNAGLNPLKIDAQVIANEGGNLDNTAKGLANDQSAAMNPKKLDQQDLTNTGLELNNRGTAADVELKEAVLPSAIDAGISTNMNTDATQSLGEMDANSKIDGANAEANIFQTINNSDFGTVEEAEAATVEMIRNSEDISPERKKQMISAINSIGLDVLQTRGTELTLSHKNALAEGGLDGLVAEYDTVDDGNTLRIDRLDDGTVSIVETRGDVERTLFSETGDNAEEMVTNRLFSQISQPGTAFEVVAQEAALQKSKAQTQLITSQNITEKLKTDPEGTVQRLAEQEIQKLKAETDNLKSGLGQSEKDFKAALTRFMSTEAFAYLGQSGEGLQDAAVAKFKEHYFGNMGAAPSIPAPDGVDPAVWSRFSDEDKAAFIGQ
jgi:hypothetical protein